MDRLETVTKGHDHSGLLMPSSHSPSLDLGTILTEEKFCFQGRHKQLLRISSVYWYKILI